MHALAKPADFDISTREGTKAGRTAGGVTSLDREFLSAITSDFFTRILSSQWPKQLPGTFHAGPPGKKLA